MNESLRQWRRILALLAVLSLVVAACGDDDEDPATSGDTTAEEEGTDTTAAEGTDDGAEEEPAEGDAAGVRVIDIVATGTQAEDGTTTHTFEAPEGITAGLAQLNLVNEDVEPHHLQLFRLNDGATIEQLGEKLAAQDIPGMLTLGAFVGGTSITDPGAESSADAIVEFEEGSYVMLCFIANAEGIPHLALGMTVPLEIGPAEGTEVAAPAADASVHLMDFGFDATELPSGGVIELVNDSETQIHEMTLLQLADGATAEDAVAFVEGEAADGPPPFSAKGGMQALMPGASQLLQLDVDPGEYLIVCFIPDPADGVPHAKKGMAQTLTVT